MRLKKLLCIVLACAAVIGCLTINAGAVEVVEQEIAIVRATNNFNAEIPGNLLFTNDKSFPLDIGETITISATYKPNSASVDFGFIAPDGLFYSANTKTGNFYKTFKVSQKGYYTLAIRNNSSNTVSVSGYVIY